MMKPQVWSYETWEVGKYPESRRMEWAVDYIDPCGCHESELHFKKFTTALRFAYHVAMGGSRWEFVA